VHDLDKLSYLVIGVAIQIHARLGPGLLESVYHTVLVRELATRGLFIESKKPISFEYGGHWFEEGFEADLIVERCLVIEVKSVLALNPVFEKQLLTYLRLLNCKLGLVLNFNTPLMKDGIKRVVNNF
jgi:iron complex transport system substrate-binding protein